MISLLGGSKGLLVNNTNLCTAEGHRHRQARRPNGKTADSNPKVAVAGCKPRKKQKPHKHQKRSTTSASIGATRGARRSQSPVAPP